MSVNHTDASHSSGEIETTPRGNGDDTSGKDIAGERLVRVPIDGLGGNPDQS
jgi:hypothetical protein